MGIPLKLFVLLSLISAKINEVMTLKSIGQLFRLVASRCSRGEQSWKATSNIYASDRHVSSDSDYEPPSSQTVKSEIGSVAEDKDEEHVVAFVNIFFSIILQASLRAAP